MIRFSPFIIAFDLIVSSVLVLFYFFISLVYRSEIGLKGESPGEIDAGEIIEMTNRDLFLVSDERIRYTIMRYLNNR